MATGPERRPDRPAEKSGHHPQTYTVPMLEIALAWWKSRLLASSHNEGSSPIWKFGKFKAIFEPDLRFENEDHVGIFNENQVFF